MITLILDLISKNELIVNLIIRRNDETQLIIVKLRNESGGTELINKRELEKESTIYGALFIDIDANTKKRLNINGGVKVQSIENGKLKDAGLKTGFIVTHIDKQKVTSKDQLINTFRVCMHVGNSTYTMPYVCCLTHGLRIRNGLVKRWTKGCKL